MARALTGPLSDSLGTQVLVDNKAGATGNIATSDAIRSAADGYTLLVASTYAQTVNPYVMKGSPNMATDLVPVAIIGRLKLYLAVRSDLKANNLQELIALAKASPGKLNYASAGVGSPIPFECWTVQAAVLNRLDAHSVQGIRAGIAAVLSKEADMVFDPGLALQHINSGRVKLLAITSDRRPAKFPAIPTFNETGVKGMEAADVWVGVWAKKGTPPEIVDQLGKAVASALQQDATKKRFEDITAEALYMDSVKFKQLLENETKTMNAVIQKRHITVE